MPIYKYVSEDRLSILEDGLIRFTQPRAFNDPFEFRPHIYEISDDEYLDDALDEQYDEILETEYSKLPLELKSHISLANFKSFGLIQKGEVRENLRLAMKAMTPLARKGVFDGIEGNIGVLSLTKCPLNLLMWAHYANCHQGFVLEFDENHEYFNRRLSETDELRYMRKVDYQSDRPKVSLMKVESFDVFLIKGKEWEYEQEWRMLLPLRDADKVISMKPHDIHLYKIPFSAIKSVILGDRVTTEIRKEAKHLIVGREELSHVRLYQSRVDEKEFKLNIEELSI